jgi:ATP-dependent Clp protease protease subunit
MSKSEKMSLPPALARAREMRMSAVPQARTMARINAATATGELYLYNLIGQGFFSDGITAESVQAALAGMKGAKALNVFINSEGGDVFEGKAIHNVIKRFDGKKTVYVDGICASIATHIAMAGDEIITAANATWMIHDAWTIAMGNASDLRAAADIIERETQSLAEAYAARTGKKCNLAQLRGMMAEETWLQPKDALKYGFTDKVEERLCPECGEDPCACEDESNSARYAAATHRPLIAAYKNVPERLKGKRATNASRIAAMDMRILQTSQRRACPPLPSPEGLPAGNSSSRTK